MRRGTLAWLLALALAGTGCAAKAAPHTPVDAPGLAVAPPPSRVIVPAPATATMPPVEEPPVVATPPGAATPPRPRDPVPTRPTPPVTSEPPATPPATVILTPANAAEFERRIRAQLTQAEGDLGRVNRQTLGREARAQFDAAQGFVRQCHDALRARNLPLAGQLADKAATMAALLRK